MGLCVFCSSVFFCEKKNIVGVCVDSFFSHRAHRVHGGFKRTVSSPQNASGIQSSQSVTAINGVKSEKEESLQNDKKSLH